MNHLLVKWITALLFFGLVTPVTHAKGTIDIKNLSERTWRIKFYNGDDGLKCSGLGVPYKTIKLASGDSATVGCKANGTGGCWVKIEAKDLYDAWRMPPDLKAWECAKIQGDARMRFNGNWNSDGSSLSISCLRTGGTKAGESCVKR